MEIEPATIDSGGNGSGNVVASVRDLEVEFKTGKGIVRALRGVSLDIHAGEVVALVGESGSGKSVFGMSLLGLLQTSARPTIRGQVHVAGIDMLHGAGGVRRRVRQELLGAVFQDPLTSLNPTMRVGRQLLERGIDRERALRQLGEAGVPDPERRFRQYPHELSGGLRQRVMIAMALGGRGDIDQSRRRKKRHAPVVDLAGAEAAELPVTVAHDASDAPRLIVADEPTTALDVSVQAQVVLLFDRLRREHGCAVLLVTHDLGVAASIADRVVVLYGGRVCEVGPAASVLRDPAHPYTKALLAARLSVDGTTVRTDPMPGDPPNPLALPPGCAFAPRCSSATVECEVEPPELTPRAREHAGEVACLHPCSVGEADASTSRVAVTMTRVASPRPAGAGDALELVDVSKTYEVNGGGLGKAKLVAVDSVTLTVPARGSVALVGESGCGKTTTLRIATGLLQPDRGSVRWAPDGGRPQLIFQDCGSSLTPWMSIGMQVEERLRMLGVPKGQRQAKALDYLGRVGLDRRASESKPRELSGGQRQRAVIARALASDPKLLVCDEPVSALDASLAVRVLTLLESLRDDLGVALLVVTHDLAAARRIADEVAVMYLGAIVEQAPADVLFEHPSHPYTQGLIAASPTTEPGRLSPTLAGEAPSAIGERHGCAFAPRCPVATEVCVEETPEFKVRGAGLPVACHHA
ncbi:MAG: oligopeptide/dipeptide transporter, ATP-binding protein [Actinomycetia bacterium]|nr:oligopeptide/dipeptide transporter, ATP-binding protein [Actinomycetes bacterium]